MILAKPVDFIMAILIVLSLVSLRLTASNNPVSAHRSGCHRYHRCPSDTGNYVCGDLGYDSQCPKKHTSSSKDNTKSEQTTKDKVKAKDCQKGYHESANTCVPNKIKASKIKPTNFTNSNSNLTVNKKCLGLADCFEGRVTEVIDGDTLDVNNVRIRLALVNTPEVYEKGYLDARTFVMTNCGAGTHAIVDEDDGQKGGSFGRMIALVYCGNNTNSLNEALLNSSKASILPQFCGVSEFASSVWAKKYGCS
jgi:endonuclease YncB( thermonuclease family)